MDLFAAAVRITGTDGVAQAAVKPGGTPAVASDPALVVSISPNTAITVFATNPSVGPTGGPTPADATYIGVSNGGSLLGWAGDASGHGIVVGAGAAGTPNTGVVTVQGIAGATPIPVSGSITATNPSVGATGAAAPGSATYVGLLNGMNLIGWLGDAAGRGIVAGGGTAGTPAGGVLTVQGITSGTALNIVGTGTAGVPGTAVLTVQGIGSGTPIAISGSVTATNPSVGTTGAAIAASATYVGLLNGVNLIGWLGDAAGRGIVAGGGTAGTPAGGVLTVQGVASGTNLNVAQATAASLNATVVQGTAAAIAGAWPSKLTDGTNGPVAVKPASTAAAATDPALVVALSPTSLARIGDYSGSGTLGALNSTTAITCTGCSTVTVSITGIWSGVITIEGNSGDGNWIALTFWSIDGISTSGSISSNQHVTVPVGGFQAIRARMGVYTSGTANLAWNSGVGTGNVTLVDIVGSSALIVTGYTPVGSAPFGYPNLMGGVDGGGLTRAILTDTGGRQQIILNDTANHGPVAVKAASTAAVAADPALVVAVSPNNTVNIAGTGTAGASGTAVLTVQGIAGGTPMPISGSVTATNPSVGATGAAIPASATYVGLLNGVNLIGWLGDAAGRGIVAGGGTAGTPAGGVLTVQGVTSGTSLNVVGTGTAGVPGTAVLTVQGIGSGTAIPISGSVTTAGTTTPADAFANPTTATLGFNLLGGYNGTTWDRLKSAANNADAVAVTTLGNLQTGAFGYMYNGTTWDRMRGTAAAGLTVAQATASNLNATVVQGTAANLKAQVVGISLAMADAASNTQLVVQDQNFLFGYNGSTWDRLRSAANNADAVAVTTLGNLQVGAFSYVYNGTTWDRLRVLPASTLVVASNPALIVAQSMNGKLPTFVSTVNSSTANLTSGSSFIGTSESTLGYTAASISIKSDAACSIWVQQSSDGTNWDINPYQAAGGATTFTNVAGQASVFTVPLVAAFYRVYCNNTGGPNSTYLRLQTVLQSSTSLAGDTTPVDSFANPNNNSGNASLVSFSLLAGWDQGNTVWNRLTAGATNADAQGTINNNAVLSVRGLGFGYNGTTWDRLRSSGNNADAVATGALGLLSTGSFNYVWNGTTWDRMPGAASTGIVVKGSGTAGSAATGVVTVQGIAGGTAIPVTSSTDIAPATQNITAQDTNTTTTPGAYNQNLYTGTATAGSTATFNVSTLSSAQVQISGTWTGTLQTETSMDGGTTWVRRRMHIDGNDAPQSTFTANCIGMISLVAATQLRIRSMAAWTGTATIRVVETVNVGTVYQREGTRITDVAGNGPAAVKPASTTAVAADPSLVVTVSPNSVSSTKPASSSTTTITSVAINAANVNLKAANTARLGLTIQNDTTQILYVKLGTTATSTSYTVKMGAGQYYEVPFGYVGNIDGIWASASGGGNATITEFTA